MPRAGSSGLDGGGGVGASGAGPGGDGVGASGAGPGAAGPGGGGGVSGKVVGAGGTPVTTGDEPAARVGGGADHACQLTGSTRT
jgi:hypothetical protein